MRHPLRAGAGAGADGGDDGVELDTHPDVRAASMVPTVVSVPVNMSLWLLDAVGKSLARTWLYALGNLDTLLGWIVSRRHVAKVLRFTNAYFLVKARPDRTAPAQAPQGHLVYIAGASTVCCAGCGSAYVME